jgi:hypothetical protein
MTTKVQSKTVAYIFESVGGWYICRDDSPMLDTRGKQFKSKREAIAYLKMEYSEGHSEYTHYRTCDTSAKKLTK